MLIFHSLSSDYLAFAMPLAPSVSNPAAPQQMLTRGEGETASELSCVSDGEPLSGSLHPGTFVHILCWNYVNYIFKAIISSVPSHTCAPGHWVIWAQVAFGSTVQTTALERSSCTIRAESWICERCWERRRDLHGGE